jgi:hypothetical protein
MGAAKVPKPQINNGLRQPEGLPRAAPGAYSGPSQRARSCGFAIEFDDRESEPPLNSAFPRVERRFEFRADACRGRQIIGISSGHDVGLAAAGPCLDLGKLACNQDERLHGLLGIALLQIRIRLEEL